MTFSLDLRRFAEKATRSLDTEVRSIVLELFDDVVLRSPVDTGRFRDAWTIEGLWQPGAMPRSGSVWIVNPMDYGPRLEYGYSKQAPHGMVRLALQRIVSKYGT
ncbi:MAG: HK97 gp10 family phage protein [Rhodocyclaceae bacterium]|nr:HK97 gp10 family phage protein [Rhodocyclaceae bacterium]